MFSRSSISGSPFTAPYWHTPWMAEFCRHHGFYAPCPSCTGEEVIWEIPIVDCLGSGGVDVFRVSAGVYEDAMAGTQTVVHAPALHTHLADGLNPAARQMPPAQDHIPLRVNQPLYAKVKLLLQQ